jgi:hypothetical protein
MLRYTISTFYFQHTVACVGPLLGNDRETNNGTALAVRQQILNQQEFNYNNRRAVFSERPVPRSYKRDRLGAADSLRRED